MDARSNTTSCKNNRLEHLLCERPLEEVNELERKRRCLEVKGNKRLAAKRKQQLQEKKNVISARLSINFVTLVGYKRLQYAGPHESRTVVSRLYNFDKLTNISGGFRLYLRLMTDAILNEICDKIDDQSGRFDKAKDMDLCVSQVLRYAWSQLSEKERLTYEIVARRKIKEKCKAELNKMKNDRNTASEKNMGTAEVQWIRSLPAMPLSEFKFLSAWAKKQKENEYYHVHCKGVRCPFCENSILKDNTLQMHILYGHHNMYVYACHYCFQGFTSLEQLKKHCCKEFTQFMMQLLSQETKFEMMFAMHTLICAECNLQVPLSSLSDLPSDKKHIKLQRLLSYHNTDKLVSCVILFAVRPSEVEYVTMKACTMKCGIPLQCKFCSHKFISAVDIEKHPLSEHSAKVTKLKCPVCPRFYITDCFFRDHLLSHLGEVHSVTGLLYKATFWPSAFSRETTFKMGPLLQKIIGSDVTESSRVEKLNDLSDDEDESYEKSILRGKRRVNEKKRSKKLNKGTDQDLCYYCRHAKQLTTKPLQSSLCQCNKSKHEPESFIAQDSFVSSLVEKFTREGRLYVDKKDSILDTSIGAIIDDSVFICVKCKGLHLDDQNTLKHLRICMQKDVESPDPEKHYDLMDSKIVIRLTPPHCSPNGRISCPECEVTSCSIAGLRRHLALDHGIFAYYNIPESHRGIGIMEYVPSRTIKDTKLDIATRTNLELNLTPDGNFKLHQDKRPQSPPLISESSARLTSKMYAAENLQVDSMSVKTRPTLVQPVVEPPQSSTIMDKFICIVCSVTSDSSQQLANHFIHSHLYLCSECGSGFIEKQCLLSHLAACQKWPRKCSDGEFFPRCPICNFLLLTPERYFYHLLHSHKADIYINPKNQQINPMFIWKKLSLTDAAKFRKTMDKLVVKSHADFVAENVVYSSAFPKRSASSAESAVANKFLCVLCELDFPNQAECDIHLQKHSEQWTYCPVCMYFRDHCPIRTIGELFEHLLFKHIVKSLQPKGVKIVCTLCRSLSSCELTTPLSVKRCEEQMIRHILYVCNGTQVCFLCNDGAVYSPEKLKKHRLSEHRVIFERFGCSECSRKFHTCSAFRKHTCSVSLRCSCGVNSLFTEEEFEKHFEIHLNSMKDFCLLCNKYMFSKDQLFSHVTSHRIIVNGTRQLVQLSTTESVMSFPAPNIRMHSNMNINVPSKERNDIAFPFGKMKVNNDDDEIQFLGLGCITNDANSSENKDQKRHGDNNDVVFVAETVPTDFMTNVRPEIDALIEAVPSFCIGPTRITKSALTVKFSEDETVSVESGSTAAVLDANAANIVCGVTDGQNPTTTNECSTTIVEKEFISTKPSSVHTAIDDENDVSIIDELKNENPGISKVSDEVQKVDRTGDPDLQVIENAERCIRSRKISKREAKFCCSQCTEKFLTRASLLIHKETHKYDAGQTIEAVYGIPTETILYICRLCCLAYESQAVYQMHMRTHGMLQNCERCSVVAFNEEQIRNHQNQHVPSADKQQAVYVCSKCVTTYSTDERLYHHMFIAHAQPILYFCKSCGLANTNGRVVYEHIVQRRCSWQILSSVPEIVIMGFTAACIFHYQPTNSVQYENRVRNNELVVVIPSECIHRSFLSHPNDVINITCPTCNSLMSFLRLQAENSTFTGSLPRTLNHAADDNDGMMFTMLNIWRMKNIDQQTSTLNDGNRQTSTLVNFSSTCTLSQVAISSDNPAHVAQSAMLLPISHSEACIPQNGTNFQPCIPTVAPSISQPSASSTSMQSNSDSSPSSSKTPPYLQPYRGVLEAVGLTVGTQMINRDYIVKNAEGGYFCARPGCANIRIEKITSGRVHNLRHNPQNIFFCLECGSAFPFENLIVKHMVEFHHQKQTPLLNLRCPLCPETLPFTRVELFRKHMAESTAHPTAHSFTFKQRCKLRFYSIEARLRHEHEHRATKNAPCCFVCGTSRNWWSSSPRADFPYIDHSYIHAFSLWGMCRECGLCYLNELKNEQYLHHFEDQHIIKTSDTWRCKICNIELDNYNVHVHALQRHFVIGVKTDRRKPYAIETSDAMMRAFLGCSVPNNARI